LELETRGKNSYINGVPVASKLCTRNVDKYAVEVIDGELFLPQVVMSFDEESGRKVQLEYYLKVSRKQIKELLDYYNNYGGNNEKGS